MRVQAKYEAAEVRVRHAQEALTQQEAEAVKLEQRLAAAREQYDSGLAKLRFTARQLESLASQARTAYRGQLVLLCSRVHTTKWPQESQASQVRAAPDCYSKFSRDNKCNSGLAKLGSTACWRAWPPRYAHTCCSKLCRNGRCDSVLARLQFPRSPAGEPGLHGAKPPECVVHTAASRAIVIRQGCVLPRAG